MAQGHRGQKQPLPPTLAIKIKASERHINAELTRTHLQGLAGSPISYKLVLTRFSDVSDDDRFCLRKINSVFYRSGPKTTKSDYYLSHPETFRTTR